MRLASPRSATTPIRRILAAPIRSTMLGIPLLAALAAAGCAHVPPAPGAAPGAAQGPTLQAFRSQAEWVEYHKSVVAVLRSKPVYGAPPAVLPQPPIPGAEPVAEPQPEPEPPTPRAYGDPIVRVQGDYLLVVRKGRLSTFRIAGGALEPAGSADALGPDPRLEGLNIHELGVSGDDVRVIALDGRAGMNLVSRFRLGSDGSLAYRDGWWIRTSGSHYAHAHTSRRVGETLVFYDQIPIEAQTDDLGAVMPTMRPAAASDTAARMTASPERVYRPVHPLHWDDRPMLHTVTVCGAEGEGLGCAATALYAPEIDVVHVSPRAVYLWSENRTATGDEEEPAHDVLYRLPLDGSAPTAVQVAGAPLRPEAFLESADGHLNVALLHDGWTEESRSRTPVLALLRLPLSDFGDGRGEAAHERYRPLPRFAGRHYSRFVGDWLLYGNRPHSAYMVDAGLAGGTPSQGLGFGTLRWADTAANAWYAPGGSIEGFEPLRDNAALVLLGAGDSLQLGFLRLGNAVRAAGVWRPGIIHDEGRMYGVVHHPDGAESGLVGLPVGIRPTPYSWRSTAAAFLRYDSAGIRSLGELAPRGTLRGDREIVPIFAHGRTFALVGDELVEAVEENGALREVRRIRLP